MRKHSGFGWLELIIGILLLALGILTFVKPDLALTSLVFAYGFAAIVMGIADIILYIQIERFVGFGPILSLISGMLSVMAGMMLIVYPRTGVIVLTLLFPIWFIAHCISRLVHLDRIRFIAGNGVYYVSLIIHVIGLILGCLMLLKPLLALTTIRFLAGIYLILLGADSVMMAFSRMGKSF